MTETNKRGRVAPVALAIVCVAITATIHCGSGEPLTDDVVVRYIAAYKELRQVAPQAAQSLANTESEDPDVALASAEQGYDQIDAAVSRHGFDGYADFVRVNARIAHAFNQAQARGFMQRMDRMQEIGRDEIDRALADPNVPEETKAELRAAREQMVTEYESNRVWADGVMQGTELLTDDEDIAVVLRHLPELEEAFAGFKIPQQNEFMGQSLD